MNEIYRHALKLLSARDYTAARLRQKLESRFGAVPESVIRQLTARNFINDRRFAENYIARHQKRGAVRLREALVEQGVSAAIIEEMLANKDWPSIQDALKARMDSLKLRSPLQPRDAARLFRALARLGYNEDAIREAIEQLDEQ